MITDIDKWLRETPVKKWNYALTNNEPDKEIQEIIKGATYSLLAYPGSAYGVLFSETWQVLRDKFQTLKTYPEGAKGEVWSTTFIMTQRHNAMQNILKDFLGVSGFNAYASASPGLAWEPFCFIADDTRGIVGCADGYRTFDDCNLAYVIQRWVLAGQLGSGYLQPLFPPESADYDVEAWADRLWNPDLTDFVDNNLRKVWKENFSPCDPILADMLGPDVANERDELLEEVLPDMDSDTLGELLSSQVGEPVTSPDKEPLDEADVALRKGLGVTDLDMEKYCTRRAERDVKEVALLKDFCLVQAWASTKQPEGDLSAKDLVTIFKGTKEELPATFIRNLDLIKAWVSRRREGVADGELDVKGLTAIVKETKEGLPAIDALLNRIKEDLTYLNSDACKDDLTSALSGEDMAKNFDAIQGWASPPKEGPAGSALTAEDLVTIFKGTKEELPAINDLLKKIKEASGAEHVKVHFCLNDMNENGVIEVNGVVEDNDRLHCHFLRNCCVPAEHQDRKKRKSPVEGVADAEKGINKRIPLDPNPPCGDLYANYPVQTPLRVVSNEGWEAKKIGFKIFDRTDMDENGAIKVDGVVEATKAEAILDDVECGPIYPLPEGVDPDLVIELLRAEGPKAFARGVAASKKWWKPSWRPVNSAECENRFNKIMKGIDPDAPDAKDSK